MIAGTGTRADLKEGAWRLAGPLGLALLSFLLALACITFTRAYGHVAAVWLGNAVTLAVLLRQPGRRWGVFAGAAAAGYLSANLVSGETLAHGLALAACNLAEVLVCAGLMTRWIGGRIDLTRPGHIMPFTVAGGLIAPAVSAAAGATILHLTRGAPVWPTALQWHVSDALGILIVTPAALALTDGGLRRLWSQVLSGAAILPFLGLAFSLILVFGQGAYPLSFLLLPALLLIAYKLEAAASALALLVTALVAVVATLNGLGPTAPLEVGLGVKLGLVQALLASITLVSLPLAAIRTHAQRLDTSVRGALAKSELAEQRLRLASQIAGIGYWRRPIGATETEWSDETYALHGLPPAGPGEANGGAADLYLEEDRERLRETIDALFATGEPNEVKARLRRGDDGRLRTLHYRGEVERDDSGAIIALFGVVRDITDEETFLQQIEESEARYRLLAESSTDVVIKTDLDWRLQYVSPSARRYGYDPEKLIGSPGLELIHPDDLGKVAEITAALLATGVHDSAQDSAIRIRDGAGAYVWMEGQPVLLKDEQGRASGIISALRDVSERVAAQRELERSEARYRLLTENATDVIACYGTDSVLTYVSPAVRDLSGYEPHELVGRKIHDLMHPDDIGPTVKLFTDYLAAGRAAPPLRFEYRAFRKDGSMVWLEAHPRAVYDPQSHAFVEFQDVVRDVTERKAMEAALAESERRYRFVADNLTDIITRAGMDSRIRYISPSVTGLLGYSVEELIGRSILPLVHPDDLAGVQAGYADLIAGRVGEGFGVTYRIRHKNGHWVWLESRPTAVRGVDGRVREFVDLTRDVTARTVMEAELREARDAAQAAAAIKAEFMANMSHEIRTPLTAILGFTSLLANRGELDDDVRYQVDRIAGAGQALLAIVNDILDFSKLEAGLMPIEPQAASPHRTLADACALFEPQAEAKGIALDLRCPADIPAHLSFDPDRVRQILLNLIGNAVKFTDEGQVVVEARYDEPRGRLCVSVRDTGVGMEPEQQSKLFQRFSQVDASSSRRHGGTGLGLAICSGLVQAMGGTIGVTSAVGRGSEFRFEIPAEPCAAPAAVEAELGASLLDGLRVLVVDDNAVNRELARAILAPLGAEVEEAADGPVAVERALAEPFDIILMDIRMPGMDGPEATSRIRAQAGPNQQTAILAFSADYDLERFGEQDARGFNGFVRKPLELHALVEAIAACVGVEEDGEKGPARASA
ncbi:MAG: PAS domain S-box protein [Pseudomonadota bacterium]